MGFVFFHFIIPLWSEVSLESTFEGIIKENELVISVSEDLRMTGGISYPWSCSLFLDIPAPPASPADTPVPAQWGGSFSANHFSLGRLILTGAYDRLESRFFPSLYNWDRGPRLTLEKKSAFKGRWGGALHDRNKMFILHYLDYPDYSQGGFFYDSGDNPLGMEGGILYSSLGEKTVSDTSWYNPGKPVQRDDLIHMQGTWKLVLLPNDNEWNLRGEGALFLSRLSRKASRLMFSLSFQGEQNSFSLLSGTHFGSWKTCSGLETDWTRGARAEFLLFNESPVRVKGDYLLWYRPDRDNPSHGGNLSLENDFFALLGGADFDSPDSLFSWTGGGRLTWAETWGYLQGEGSCFMGETWKEEWILSGKVRGRNFSITSSLALSREYLNRISLMTFENEWLGQGGFSFSPSPLWDMEGSVRIIMEGENPHGGEYQFSLGIKGKY